MSISICLHVCYATPSRCFARRAANLQGFIYDPTVGSSLFCFEFHPLLRFLRIIELRFVVFSTTGRNATRTITYNCLQLTFTDNFRLINILYINEPNKFSHDMIMCIMLYSIIEVMDYSSLQGGRERWRNRERERERLRERGGRERESERERERDRLRESEREREIERDRETERQRDRETERQRDRERLRELKRGEGWREREGGREREIEREGGGRERLREREGGGREGGTERERERVRESNSRESNSREKIVKGVGRRESALW